MSLEDMVGEERAAKAREAMSIPSTKLGGQFEAMPGFEGRLDRAISRVDATRGTHGTATRSGMAPSTIQPANEHGRYSFAMSDHGRTYFTGYPKKGNRTSLQGEHHGADDPGKFVSDRGWNWAHEAAGNMPYTGQARARPFVTHVEPQGRVDLDYNLNTDGRSAEFTADSLTVHDVEWIPPPSFKDKGVQGTLPNENWNKWPKLDNRESNYERIHDHPYSTDRPHSKSEQFKDVKSNMEIPGQMEMIDRPGTWDRPGEKGLIPLPGHKKATKRSKPQG